ncbi:MAG TPA: tetratricopeptide repeat protein [Anaeromyxobacteraceae bacterium]|nr:tetratricopeptide repeat protein [Anaeromyxobacteraceae bacterium]
MVGDGEARSLAGRDWLALGLLVAVVFLAYQPCWAGALLWDDAAHLTRAELRPGSGLLRIWFELGATQQYYPLVHSAFWLQHRLWGDATLGYHLVNLALHATAAILVAVALRRLAVPGAILAAALFALHPVQVESVAWITEQKNTLSAVFYLAAGLAWLRFEDRRDASSYLLALAMFLLALSSKTVTATLPAALLLLHWWRRGRPTWKHDVLPLLPFFLLGAAAGVLTAWVERHLVGAEGGAFQLSPAERVLVAGRAAWFYLGKLIWPTDLVFIYPRWVVSQDARWQYLYPASLLGALAALWLLRRRLPGPFVAALFFLGTLLPALGFVDIYPFLFSFVADHFQYLASIGIIALASAGATLTFDRSPPWRRRVVGALCVSVLAALSALTLRQSQVYVDRETLYRSVIRGNPGCWMAYNNLASALLSRGAVDEALPLAEKALELRPGYPEAHNNLALALGRQGRGEEAIAHFQRALSLDPAYAEAHNNLAFLLADRGLLGEAITHYRRALQIEPSNPGMNYNLAMALVAHGEPRAAAVHLRRALEVEPEFVEARNNLGILLARAGRIEEAIAQFREALRIRPDSTEVRRNLDAALASGGSSK